MSRNYFKRIDYRKEDLASKPFNALKYDFNSEYAKALCRFLNLKSKCRLLMKM